MTDDSAREYGFELEGPTDHECAAAAKCAERVVGLEMRVGELASGLARTALTDHEKDALATELDLAMSELGFWRSKHGSLVGRHPDASPGDYILVPRRPSSRAVCLANGYTDLVDVSRSPRDMEATRAEIDLAIRIANEEDGVAVMLRGNVPEKSLDQADLMARLEDRQRVQHRLSDAEQELTKLAARYLALREAVAAMADGEGVLIGRRETSLDAIFGNPVPDVYTESARGWRELFARHVEAG